MTDIVIIGCGDVGRRAAQRWLEDGRTVSALVRSAGAAQRLRAAGIAVLAADLDRPADLPDIDCHDAVVCYFAPPPPSGAGDPRLAAFATRIRGRPARFIYISTSGVYGNCRGAWVTEDTAANPVTARGRRRLAAEQLLRVWAAARQVPLYVLRVPAIYGSGRLPLERIRRGEPVVVDSEAPFTNRIHVEDLVGVCLACAGHPGPVVTVLNVSDGHPTTMTEYFNRVADRFGLPRPPAVSLTRARQIMSPAMYSFWRESRRLDNRRMLQVPGVTLQYPTLEAGLAACAQ